MIHHRRRFSVADIATAEELAQRVTGRTLCGCNGFRLAGYLFLNDSFSEDGAQEYAVYRVTEDGSYVQIESITFGWCSEAEALAYIREIADGTNTMTLTTGEALTVQTPTEHGRCQLCA
jgi:hypothetical protein